jgi:uncharacterized protein (DUF1697 family)
LTPGVSQLSAAGGALTVARIDRMSETYAALLRGVNVGGRGKLPMPELVKAFESLGHEHVRSYIQSGNVVFRSTGTDAGKLSDALERMLSETFGLETRVVLRTHAELEAVAAGSPFDEALHVVFLDGEPTPAAVATLDPDRSPGDRFEVAGSEIYLSLANGAGRTKLTLDWLERRLGVAGTQRNWNTVLKLIELTAPPTDG